LKPAGLAEDENGTFLLQYRIMKRITIAFLVAGVGLPVLATLASAILVAESARGKTYSDARAIPHRHLGLLLGSARLLPSGALNAFYQNRLDAAVELYRAGKIDYLLVSGESQPNGYNEPAEMKASLVLAGVPAEKIYSDPAGFRTLDSVVRAKEVFGQTEVTIISQELHNRRAIFIAGHQGIDAIGFDAAEVGTFYGLLDRCREQFADVNAVLDIFLFRTRPRFLSPKSVIPSGRGT
jgi:SanA protein